VSGDFIDISIQVRFLDERRIIVESMKEAWETSSKAITGNIPLWESSMFFSECQKASAPLVILKRPSLSPLSWSVGV